MRALGVAGAFDAVGDRGGAGRVADVVGEGVVGSAGGTGGH